jgi:hypothetical protein
VWHDHICANFLVSEEKRVTTRPLSLCFYEKEANASKCVGRSQQRCI